MPKINKRNLINVIILIFLPAFLCTVSLLYSKTESFEGGKVLGITIPAAKITTYGFPKPIVSVFEDPENKLKSNRYISNDNIFENYINYIVLVLLGLGVYSITVKKKGNLPKKQN